MSPIVLDASITCAWAMPDEDSDLSKTALDRLASSGARVPWIWWFEVRNVLLVSTRRQRISRSAAGEFLRMLGAFRILIDDHPDEGAIYRLAMHHSLSFYDGAYLDLAIRASLPLATLDGRVKRAAAEEDVALLAPT